MFLLNKNKLDVVFSIDENYIQHFCVAITSLLENNLNKIDRIFLIHDIQEKSKLEKTVKFIYKKYNKIICNFSINNLIDRDFKVDGHISKATYYRLYLSELLPTDVDRVLFLDSDLIINGNIEFLLSLDFNKTNHNKKKTLEINNPIDNEIYLYAVSNLSDQKKERLKNLGLTGEKYFNAGVLLINLKKWRENNILNTILKVEENNKNKILLHDQDILNIVFENLWGELPTRYNAINLEFCPNRENIENYNIIHFTNYPKPWNFINTHPFKMKYWEYLRKTPYKLYIPNDFTLDNILELKIIPKIKYVYRKLPVKLKLEKLL